MITTALKSSRRIMICYLECWKTKPLKQRISEFYVNLGKTENYTKQIKIFRFFFLNLMFTNAHAGFLSFFILLDLFLYDVQVFSNVEQNFRHSGNFSLLLQEIAGLWGGQKMHNTFMKRKSILKSFLNKQSQKI